MAEKRNWLVALPTAMTLGNALCGFGAVAVLARPNADPGTAAMLASWLILGAWACDMGDGMVARLTGTTGKFGAALDSLCDVVGFGIAPAYLVMSLTAWGGVGWFYGWLAGAVLLSCVLIRLARFDTEDVGDAQEPDGHLYFRGFPSPAVGVVIAAIGLTYAQVLLSPDPAGNDVLTVKMLASGITGIATPIVALIVGALAVSTWVYPDMPKHYLKGLAPWWHLILLALAMMGMGPGPALLAYFALYALLGPWIGRRATP